MTDVLAYSAAARDAAVEERALPGEARRRPPKPRGAVRARADRTDRKRGRRAARRETVGRLRAGAHFAFWTRRAALMKLAASFKARVPQNALARPRGLVFHLPPQNVETVFLYSWALAYLAGNANIVRLPQAIGAQMRAIVDLFLEKLEAAGDPSQFFVHYSSQGDLGAKISALSDARVVWGGDTKVALFAPCRCATAESRSGSAIGFPSRRSTAPRSTISTSPRFGRSPSAEWRIGRSRARYCQPANRYAWHPTAP